MKTTAYPSRVGATPIGQGLVAEETVEEETVVEKLEGPAVPYGKIPDNEIRYAFETDTGRWVIARSNARYINHSCDPNCYIAENLDVLTSRKVRKGEDLAFMTNETPLANCSKSGSIWQDWDE